MPVLSGHVARTRSRSPGQQTFEAITRGQVRFRMRHTYLYLRLDERNTAVWLRRRRTVAGEREVVLQFPTMVPIACLLYTSDAADE